LCSFYGYVFSSTKLEIRAEQVLPGSKKGGAERVGEKDRERSDPNNVCTCEYMNNKKKSKKKRTTK
jgi:hypothetical protein